MYKIDIREGARPKIGSTLVYNFWPTPLLTILFMTTYVSENLLLIIFYYLGLGSGKTVSGRSAAARTGNVNYIRVLHISSMYKIDRTG